jgi:conjugal transfer pilus assembly protein TraU
VSQKLNLSAFFIFICLSFCEAKFMNPLTDVCWECVFPITVSGVNVTPGYTDLSPSKERTCSCPGTPPKVGVPLTFWEPIYLVDVTKHAYQLNGLGGISVGPENVKNRGSVGVLADGTKTSFYHVHWYQFPLFSLLDLFADFVCVEKSKLDIPYMSELDPTWNDETLSLLLNPEAIFFSNPLAQLACLPDCAASSFNRPLDALFWCAGCEGSLYPLSGTVAHHVGGIQASYLLTHRLIAKLHRCSFLKGFEKDNFCEAKYLPIIKKTLYKTQLVHPIPQTKGPCHALGKSDLFWGMGKSFPGKGEDFVYLIWVKKQCCLDAVKPAAAAAGVQAW